MILIAVFLSCVAACHKRTEPKLKGDAPDPGLMTQGLNPDLFIVVNASPYGHENRLSLVVAEDGSRNRSTFVAPTAMGLKKGDVIKVHRLCYRSQETYSAEEGGKVSDSSDACTDIVIPHSAPTAEAVPK